jgi:phosphoglycerol transferase MdoB-like AlkP superfamily enzyme
MYDVSETGSHAVFRKEGIFNLSTPLEKSYCSLGKQHLKPSSLFDIYKGTTYEQRFIHAWRETQISKSDNPRTQL